MGRYMPAQSPPSLPEKAQPFAHLYFIFIACKVAACVQCGKVEKSSRTKLVDFWHFSL